MNFEILNAVLPSSPLVTYCGLALLHFLWQGMVVAALASLLLSVTRKQSAATRYLVATMCMLVMAICPVATYWTIALMHSSEIPSRSAHENTSWIRTDSDAQNFSAISQTLRSAAHSIESPNQVAPNQLTPIVGARIAADAAATLDHESMQWTSVVVILWLLGIVVLSIKFHREIVKRLAAFKVVLEISFA